MLDRLPVCLSSHNLKFLEFLLTDKADKCIRAPKVRLTLPTTQPSSPKPQPPLTTTTCHHSPIVTPKQKTECRSPPYCSLAVHVADAVSQQQPRLRLAASPPPPALQGVPPSYAQSSRGRAAESSQSRAVFGCPLQPPVSKMMRGTVRGFCPSLSIVLSVVYLIVCLLYCI